MNSVQILLSDTHFGVRNNSINWLESQKDFVYNQFIPYLKKLPKGDNMVIHLGDVFDSRSSISPMICKETNLMLEKIAENCTEFIIIAGNHDFFSPIEGMDNSTSLEMLPCLWKENNIRILYQNYWTFGVDNVFIPWFQFHNIETLKKIMKDGHQYKNVFTHTDIANLDKETLSLLKGKDIFTGHIHIPDLQPKKGYYTLGSCFSINYQDSNSDRGFYTMKDWDAKTLEFHPNTKSLRFYRITDEEVLDFSDYEAQDYIELTIKDSIYERPDIQEAIKNMYSTCYHFTVVIEQQEVEIESVSPETGMYTIVKNACPENLRDKLDTIVEASNQ